MEAEPRQIVLQRTDKSIKIINNVDHYIWDKEEQILEVFFTPNGYSKYKDVLGFSINNITDEDQTPVSIQVDADTKPE